MKFLFSYAQFFNDEELEVVNKFLADESHNLEHYKERIEYYHNLEGQISMEIEHTRFMEFFEIGYNSFIETIVNNVKSFKSAFVNRLVTQYQSEMMR